MKLVKVTVTREGQATIETEGFVGEECIRVTEGLERKLGGQGERTLKPEAYEQEQAREQGQ